ncbi:hypothetical protein V6N11_054138 [Hibiscus sabdariffa]|uniref:Uncharacterized protein n=1 Tax=Hibiscus sabdariffa TaxID=183260 RepID=A0ABR2S2Z8_9ROSI
MDSLLSVNWINEVRLAFGFLLFSITLLFRKLLGHGRNKSSFESVVQDGRRGSCEFRGAAVSELLDVKIALDIFYKFNGMIVHRVDVTMAATLALLGVERLNLLEAWW